MKRTGNPAVKWMLYGVVCLAVCAACAKDAPQDLAPAIAATYGEAIVGLGQVLAERPDPPEALAAIAALREDAIARMVGYGKARERVVDYEALNRAVTEAMAQEQARDAFREAQEAIVAAVHHYRTQDAGELVQAIANFNQIMFFWQLEIVRRQFPREGLAHGIE